MNWLTSLQQQPSWFNHAGNSSDVVLSSRVRIARNVTDAVFPNRLDKADQRSLLNRVLVAAKDTPILSQSFFIDLTALKKVERQFLMERHLISPEMAFEDRERGVLVSPTHQVTLMVNEEDHIRLQSFEAGLSLRVAWKRADGVDTDLGEKLPFAYDSEWGFCTTCPTNVGTGLRASCLLHLPALSLNGDIAKVLESISKMGVTARGFYGERSKAIGDLFQISNAISLGPTEKEIVESIERVVDSVVHYERQARQGLTDSRQRHSVEDAVYRSWGILRHARSISYDEAMHLFSHVRLGIDMGLDVPVQRSTLNELMIASQPAHLQLSNGGTLKAEDRDRLRATLIREKLEHSPGELGKPTK